ncbi:hypothetical protein BHM03_00026486 [Ensete ventricosum]|nr:hypothetical protein BHM03_00026486 [Ensete ventricosum]
MTRRGWLLAEQILHAHTQWSSAHASSLRTSLVAKTWQSKRKCPFSVMIWRSSAKARTSTSVDPMSSGNGQNRRKKNACYRRSMYLNDSL